MLDLIESKMNELEVLDSLMKIYKEEYVKYKQCWKTRGRIAWEHQKTQLKWMTAKKEYVEICDRSMTTEQLENWLQSQNINIPTL